MKTEILVLEWDGKAGNSMALRMSKSLGYARRLTRLPVVLSAFIWLLLADWSGPAHAQSQDMNYYHGTPSNGNLTNDITRINVQVVLGKGWDKSLGSQSKTLKFLDKVKGELLEHFVSFSVSNGVVYMGSNPSFDVAIIDSLTFDVEEHVIQGDGFVHDSGGSALTNTSASVPQVRVTAFPVALPDGSHPTGILYQMNLRVTVNNLPEDCGCDCQAGKCTPSLHSVDLRVDLGRGFLGNSYLSIRSDLPAGNLAAPVGLNVIKTSETSQLNDGIGAPRQVLSPAALADIVTLDAYTYQIRLYATNNTGPATNGLYYPNTNNLYKAVTVANPNGSTNYNSLVVTEVQPGVITNATTYSFNTNNNTWTMQSYNGLHVETLSRTWTNSNTERIELRTISETNGTARYKEQNLYHVFPWGEERIQQIIDPSGAALTSAWEFNTNSGTGGYTFLSKMVTATGYWERYEYDGVNRVIARYSSFLNAASTATSNDCRLVTTAYASSAPHETIVESVLGQEVSRKYMVYSNDVVREIQCQTTNASWTDANNLVTITTNHVGAAQFTGYVKSITHPDGTMDFYDYNDATGPRITALRSGQPNTAKTDIQEGTLYLTYIGTMGEPITNGVYAITNGTYGVPLSIESYGYVGGDSFKRSPTITHLDGLTTAIEWGCCALASTTDRDGSSTQYLYDGQNRQIGTRLNNFMLATTNLLDAAGNTLLTVRTDTNGSNITLYLGTYDLAGRSVTESNGVTGVTTHTNTFDGSGQLVKTNTFQDGGTRIETFYIDGSLKSVSGTAVHPVNYAYGADTNGLYTLEVRLTDTGGTNEWTKTYTDMVGRAYKTIYAPGSASSISYFNSKGQLSQEVDPDGDSMLYDYNVKGERAYSVLDSNRNSTIERSGADRVTFTTNDVVADNGYIVNRTRTYIWPTNSDTSNLVATVERSADGLRTWNTVHNGAVSVTSSSVTTYPGSGHRLVTSTAPDGPHTISDFLYGRLVSVTAYDSGTNQLGQTTFAYDTHGRQNVISDARTGSVTNYFNYADQVSGTRLPSADGIQSPQITSNLFDNMGRIVTNILADNTTVTSEYYLTGQPKRSYGSRTYPVGYGYDAQGRMTKMTNWSNFATTNGARVTTWTNNQYRGWLDSKHYDGTNAGPVYSYTDAGRLQNRLWARGTNTTYSYNNAGDLATVMYDDGLTLGITNGYDRRGRLISIINGPSTCSLAYDDAGNLQTESYSGGVLDLVSIQNIYDDFLRRKTNITKYNGSNLTIVTNNYDTGGRLSLIGDGTNSATYSYLANSPLVSQILFQQNGSNRMTMKQGFDNLNRLTGITNANPSSVTLDKHTYAYNSANQRTAVTQTDNSVWSFGYDALGQVTSGRKYWGDSSPVAGQQFGYTFDDIGNRTQTQVGGNELGLGLRSANYSANSLNQYESRSVPGAVDILGSANSSAIVTVNGTSTSRHGDYFRSEVGIDNGTGAAFQSVTAKAVVGGATNLLSTVSGNVYVPQNPEYFSYDADGNLTQDGRWTFTWDAENRLIKMTSLNSATMASKYKLDFAYDYFGRRIQKLVSTNNGSYIPLYTNRFVYDGWNLIDELNPAGGISRSYIWGLDLSGSQKGAGGVGGLLVVNAAASSQFTCFDGNGNVAALVDVSTSGLTGQYEYGPFGETIGVSGSTASANPIRFSSKYNETEAETINYGHRIYATQSGRWLSRDILDEPGFLASRRLRRLAASYAHDSYFFARNSPIATIDALGLSDRDVQNFKEAFWKLFDKMCKTKECCPERGWVQNLPFSGNLGCTKQTEKVQDMLAEIYKDKSKWDDLWEWNGVYDQTGPHNYSIMASGNPKDPVIKLDTWKGCLITYTMDSDETRPLKQWKDWLGETFDHDHFLYIKKKECFTCAERAKNKAK